jgi:hypothetical protein
MKKRKGHKKEVIFEYKIKVGFYTPINTTPQKNVAT